MKTEVPRRKLQSEIDHAAADMTDCPCARRSASSRWRQRCFRPCATWRIGLSCRPALSRVLPDRISWGDSMRLRPISVLLLAVLLAMVAPPNELNAQTTTSGGLTGVVIDSSHALVPDAVVELRDNTKGTLQSAKTDRAGVYRFFFLAPSRYKLTVSRDGFREASEEVSVLLGPPGTLNITLEIAKQSTTVKVTDETPLLQAENGDVSTTMNQLQVSQVPNPGNDLTYIAQTAPGAIMNTDTIGIGYLGNFSILGMPGTSNLFTLNGMNNNNVQLNTNNSGAMGMMLGENEVQEATIVSNGYSGQFGGAAGAIVNYLTKSGGNHFHGNAAYYWNGSALNANDWIDKAVGNPRPFDIANQWAGSLGGPIKKDKLFFFLDTEGMRVLLPSSFQVVLPSAQFECATKANIDSIFGPMSASHKFYEQIFNLYNSTPGASAATPGNFNPQDPTGCNGWSGPQGLGTTAACAVHFLKNVDSPSSESILSGRVDWNMGRTTACSCWCSTITASAPLTSIRSVPYSMLIPISRGGKVNSARHMRLVPQRRTNSC